MLLDRDGVGGAAAEPRDGLGDAQRMRGPERLAQAGRVAEHEGGDDERPRPQPVDAGGVVLERERPELLERRRVEPGRRVAEQREPARAPPPS